MQFGTSSIASTPWGGMSYGSGGGNFGIAGQASGIPSMPSSQGEMGVGFTPEPAIFSERTLAKQFRIVHAYKTTVRGTHPVQGDFMFGIKDEVESTMRPSSNETWQATMSLSAVNFELSSGKYYNKYGAPKSLDSPAEIMNRYLFSGVLLNPGTFPSPDPNMNDAQVLHLNIIKQGQATHAINVFNETYFVDRLSPQDAATLGVVAPASAHTMCALYFLLVKMPRKLVVLGTDPRGLSSKERMQIAQDGNNSQLTGDCWQFVPIILRPNRCPSIALLRGKDSEGRFWQGASIYVGRYFEHTSGALPGGSVESVLRPMHIYNHPVTDAAGTAIDWVNEFASDDLYKSSNAFMRLPRFTVTLLEFQQMRT